MIHRHRLAARLLLYAVPVVAAVILWGLVWHHGSGDYGIDSSWYREDYSQDPAVLLLQEYLRIDTSYPDGNEIPGAEFLARQLEAVGIPTHIERVGSRNANMWAILEGEDPQALVLHNHIDVDPLMFPDRWRHSPFSGHIENPWIYGRGAFDMKSVTISQLIAMRELKRSGKPLKRSLIFLATGDEESGGSLLGTQWLIREHPELVERFWGVLTEGGAVEAITLDGGVRYWGTETCQKRFIDVWICDASRERLEALSEDLPAISSWRAKPQLPGVVADFLQHYGPTRGLELFRQILEHPERLLEDGEFYDLPPRIVSLMRNEVALFPIQEDPQGGGYRMRVIMHLLPGVSFDEAWRDLGLNDSLAGFAYSVLEPPDEVSCSSPEHPLFKGIDAFMARLMEDRDHGPLLIPWSATDARFFRTHGVPSYGFSPFLILSADSTKMTGPNERLPLPPFIAGVELYGDLVESLVAEPGA